MTTLQNIIEGPVTVQKRPRAEASTRRWRCWSGWASPTSATPIRSSSPAGQQQRVAITRALAMQPKLMLFDEPTSALDPELVGEVLAVMRDLAASGMTMIVVTHELGFAREVAHRVVFMDEGASSRSVRRRRCWASPQHPRTREFIAAVLS